MWIVRVIGQRPPEQSGDGKGRQIDPKALESRLRLDAEGRLDVRK